MNEKCSCCGSRTVSGKFDICPVCFWECDPTAERDPDSEGGANSVSLAEARENYRLYGACEERFAGLVRKPTAEEAE